MNGFTIKDLENLSGIKAHTIRMWEQRYQFLKPQRTATNIRYYSNDQLKTVLNIALLNKYGYKISHIDRMQSGEIRERILTLSDPDAIVERIINDLVQEMVDMNMNRFEQIISEHIHTKGIEKTVTQIIFPFLEKVGLLWRTGNINPAQEHLVSNIIRQKLIVAIETTVSHLTLNKTFLLFLPEGEHHELGLLFMYYILKSRGARAIYLGANVPLKDVVHIIETKNPDVVISGQLPQSYKRNLPANAQFKSSLQEVNEYLSSL